MTQWLLALSSLAVVLTLSCAGLMSRCYRENWLQAIGLAGIAVACGMLIDLLLEARYVPPSMALYAIASASYAVGTASKVWRHRHHRGAPRTVGGLR